MMEIVDVELFLFDFLGLRQDRPSPEAMSSVLSCRLAFTSTLSDWEKYGDKVDDDRVDLLFVPLNSMNKFLICTKGGRTDEDDLLKNNERKLNIDRITQLSPFKTDG